MLLGRLRVRLAMRGTSARWRSYSDMVSLPSERFDELIVAEAIATAHTAQPSNIDIGALLSHGTFLASLSRMSWLC